MTIEIAIESITEEEDFQTVAAAIEADGQRVGGLSLTVDDDECYIERIDIYDDFQNRGIGTATIRELCKQYSTVYAAPDNEDSKRLFERIGEDASDDYWMVDQGLGVYKF